VRADAEANTEQSRDSYPLVSVVIPTYNRAEFCQAAVRSALAQTYRPIEVVVVDDGSTDETPEVFSSNPDPVRYLRQPNSERAAARNRGVAEAEGEYVAFLDSDDFWGRHHIERSMEMLLSYPEAALAFGRAFYTTEEGTPVREAPSPLLKRGLVDIPDAVAAIATSFIPFPLSSVVARRDVLLANRFNEDRSLSRSEDWELWARIAARHQVVATGDLSTFIRMHEGNTSQNAVLSERAMRRALELAFADPITSKALKPHRNSLVAYMHMEVARLYALAGRKDEARRILGSLSESERKALDRRALRRLEMMIVLPTTAVSLARRVSRIVDLVLGYPMRRRWAKDFADVDISPGQTPPTPLR
jgi:glycosyltransferase involved in cell wall biosynthesis